MPRLDASRWRNEELGRHRSGSQERSEALIFRSVDVDDNHVEPLDMLATQLSDPRLHHLTRQTVVTRESDHHGSGGGATCLAARLLLGGRWRCAARRARRGRRTGRGFRGLAGLRVLVLLNACKQKKQQQQHRKAGRNSACPRTSNCTVISHATERRWHRQRGHENPSRNRRLSGQNIAVDLFVESNENGLSEPQGRRSHVSRWPQHRIDAIFG